MSFFKKHWPILFLSLVLSFLCFQNYVPGTFLSGWDNLHPEFNFLSNIKRSFFSVWQEYQGLGLLAGMAHAADLPRQLILFFLSLFIPQSFLRYLWHFGMIFLGTFGVYFLSLHILSPARHRFPAVIAALFYLLNFGSVQYLSLPFDPYSTFWGFLPWLILVLFNYLHHPSKLTTIQLITINLLAVPSFYVQTIFLVYLICIILILFIHFIVLIKNWKLEIRNSVKILLLIFTVNSFWLLPNLYFTLTRVSVTQNAMMNLMVTDQFQEQNYHRGHLTDFALLQEQYYDLKDYTGNQVQPLFFAWHQHFNQPAISIIGYLLFTFCLLGIFLPNRFKKYFLGILGFCAIGLLSATPPFSFLSHLLLQTPFFGQVFRNSFTKLIVPTVLSLSLLLAINLDFLSQYFSKFKHRYYFLFILHTSYLILLLIFSSPSFTGNYLHPNIKSRIPQEYFDLFNYLRLQPTSRRIMDLPQYDYWGWANYRWGQTGSGFLWYGIDQPILSRTFDVWSADNENYFWQLKYALNSHQPVYFDQLLRKYQVNYVLLDTTTFFPNAGNSNRQLRENQQLIDESTSLTLEKQFGHIFLYRVNTPPEIITQVGLFDHLTTVASPEKFSHFDAAYLRFGPYLAPPPGPVNADFPFASLFTNRPETTNLAITQNNDLISISTPFSLPPVATTTAQLSFSTTDSQITAQFAPQWTDCFSREPTLQAQNQEIVSFYNCGQLPTDSGYLLKITASNYFGRPLLFKIFSLDNNRIYLDGRIKESGSVEKYFVLPPISQFDNGIGVNFSSLSYSDSPSRNFIHSVQISPLPFTQITDFNTFNPDSPPVYSSLLPITSISHPNQTFYQIKLPPIPSPDSILTLFQSFDPGWLAVTFQGLRPVILNNHVLVNGWANAWQLPTDQSSKALTVYLFFWPQLLEFIGFTLLIGTFIWFFKRNLL